MTNQQSLDGDWELRQVKGYSENSDLIVCDWIPVKVPGEVYVDLLNANLIPDPLIEDNVQISQWISRSDWEYRKIFTVEPGLERFNKIYLCCDGLDTIAKIVLNNTVVAKTDNMFRQYRWEIHSLLNSGENELRIQFTSPIRVADQANKNNPLPGFLPTLAGSAHIRKAAYQFGWDWGPCLPSLGIWKNIRLEDLDNARIEQVLIHQDHFPLEVKINLDISVFSWVKSDYELFVQVVAPEGSKKSYVKKLYSINEKSENGFKLTNNFSIVVPEPHLWWPNDLGDHPLYKIIVELIKGETVIDQREYSIGLRSVELLREADEWGQSFTFLVNGVPLFVKGANWIPADIFPTRITSQKLETLISSTVSAHMNMLRLWGGGYYESDAFYDLCDQNGILIWQDFLFACNAYPLDRREFIDNVHKEIEDNMSRLQHHACIALWCGNNEIEWFWENMGWNDLHLDDMKLMHKKFFHEILPRWVAEIDSDRSYWPGSPGSNTPYGELDDENVGDVHYWGVWYRREPFKAYCAHKPRFVSEFGFQSLAPIDTIRHFVHDLDLSLDSPIMQAHQRSVIGNQVIFEQLDRDYLPPKDFPSLVYMSQICQAEGLRLGIEFWHRNRKRIGGVLYWQLNDCWPGTTWSSIDYFGRWKALHYAAKRFFNPLLLSIHVEESSMEIHITNDTCENQSFLVNTKLLSFDGQILTQDQFEGTIPPLRSSQVRTYDFQKHNNDTKKLVFLADLSQNGKILAQQTAYFHLDKYLEFQNPRIKAQISHNDNLIFITLSAEALARQVEIYFEGGNSIFSDNYFDLPAKVSKQISCQLPNNLDLEQFNKSLSIKSMFDAIGNGEYSVL